MKTATAPSTRRRGDFGLFSVPQLIYAQIALAILLFVPELTLPWRGGIAAGVLIVVFTRFRGRAWYVWPARYFGLRSRRRADRRDAEADLPLGPSVRLANITERGIELGVGFDGTGWFAAVALDGNREPQTAFDALSAIVAGADVPVSSVQLVTRPAPAAETGWFTPAGDTESGWYVVRLDVRGSHSVSSDRGGGVVGVHRALSGVVGRLLKGAEGTGLKLHPLTAEQLAAALRFSVDAGAEGAEPATERWRSWHYGDVAQAGFELHGKALEPEAANELWTELSRLPEQWCAVSLALRKSGDRPGDRRLALRCLVRVAGDADELDGLGRKVVELARDHEVKLRRCDGLHGPAGYASAVTGGAW